MTPEQHVKMAATSGDPAWHFHRVMSSTDRDEFDRWLVETDNPLAYEAGTAERRFLEKVRQESGR